ncbi:MAG: MATE family efflux transporter [Clostridia bacterium]|nr:MATE family efflux transporter [Clostridia bacterium]
MSLRSRNNTNLTEGNLWKQILLFFFPILIGTFFQQMYNTVDTVIVGNFVGTEALAAVGTTATALNLLIGFFIGVSSGCTVIISQFYGAEDRENVSKAVHTSMALAIVGGVVIMLIGFLGSRTSLKLMNCPDEILDDAVLYMFVYFAGCIGNLVYNIGTGVLRAVGDSKTPLYILIICCLTNIVLDLLFVVVFRWAVFGVAFATILSQLVSAICIMYRLMRTDDMYKLEVRKIRFDVSLLRSVIRIGLPAGGQSVMYSLSNLLIQTSINGFGTACIAAWSAIGKIDGFVWMIMNAFGISVTTFAGQNFGAKKYDRVKQTAKVGLVLDMACVLVLSVIIFVFRYPLLGIFTKDSEVIGIGANFFCVFAPSYFIFVFIEIFSGAIRGVGEALQPMLITCLGVCGLRIIWLTTAVKIWPTVTMVAMNYPVSWAITAVVFIVYYLRGNWMKRSIKRDHGSAALAEYMEK